MNEEKGILLFIMQLRCVKFLQRNFYSFCWRLSCLRGVLREETFYGDRGVP